MGRPGHGVDRWSTSPESGEHVPNFYSMQTDAAEEGASLPPSNSYAPQVTKTIAPPHSDGDSSKLDLPSPPGRRERMAQIGRSWMSTIYDCGEHQTNTMMTAFFPCVTFGHIAEIVDEGRTSCTLASFMYILMAPALCSCWILGSTYRRKLRKKYNLVQAPAEDWILHLFCPFCVLCQEFRELKSRGIDPSLGWMGYLAKQHHDTLTSPPQSQTMST